MASFKGSLKVEELDKELWTTLSEFTFTRDNGEVITVPEAVISDFASIPRFLWTFFPPIGKYNKSTILHDFLVQQFDNEGKRTWKECADIFLEAMESQKVSKWRRNTMYFFVLLHGYVRKKK